MDLDNFKMNPFSYYNPSFLEKTDSDKVTKQPAGEEEIEKKDSYYQLIEKKIKAKYNMLIPAIFMEIKSSNYFIEFNKEDLKNVYFIFIFNNL